MRQDALSLVRLEGLFTLLDSHPADGLVTWTELMTFAAAARHGLASKDIETSMEVGLVSLKRFWDGEFFFGDFKDFFTNF